MWNFAAPLINPDFSDVNEYGSEANDPKSEIWEDSATHYSYTGNDPTWDAMRRDNLSTEGKP